MRGWAHESLAAPSPPSPAPVESGALAVLGKRPQRSGSVSPAQRLLHSPKSPYATGHADDESSPPVLVRPSLARRAARARRGGSPASLQLCRPQPPTDSNFPPAPPRRRRPCSRACWKRLWARTSAKEARARPRPAQPGCRRTLTRPPLSPADGGSPSLFCGVRAPAVPLAAYLARIFRACPPGGTRALCEHC